MVLLICESKFHLECSLLTLRLEKIKRAKKALKCEALFYFSAECLLVTIKIESIRYLVTHASRGELKRKH